MKSLKPQDVVVLLKLVGAGRKRPSYAQLANDLFMSPSEIHASIQRAKAARLIRSSEWGEQPNIKGLEEFLIHGLKYAFPPEKGSITRGVPTSSAAEPLNRALAQEEPVPVWPFEDGTKRGYAFLPLHKSVPKAAMKDRKLYALLALVDAIRDGQSRERELARRELSIRLRNAD